MNFMKPFLEKNLKAVKFWLEHRTPIDIVDDDGQTPLMLAIVVDDLRMVNAFDKNRETSLVIAVRNGNPEIVDELLRWRSDPRILLEENQTLLMIAARWGNLEIDNLLLRYGVDPKARDHDGWTALHYTATDGHSKVARALVKAGCDPNAESFCGQNTADEIARRRGYHGFHWF